MERLETWKRILDTLEASEGKVEKKDLDELSDILQHLIPLVAARQQRDHETCVARSEKVIEELFDKIDLSNKSLLSKLLVTSKSFGDFRLAQISYTDYLPLTIEKTKWYDLTPLLPRAGTIGWKSLMTFGIIKDEHLLLKSCLDLLTQKLHYLSIMTMQDHSTDIMSIIEKNGSRVAEKLLELIRDVAYDDHSMIGIDTFLFNLLMPFTSEEQQTTIIQSIVQDVFKPFTMQKCPVDGEATKIHDLVHNAVMCHPRLQGSFVLQLLEHLKCNIIRRKRRHSVEASIDGNLTTLESILEKIIAGTSLAELIQNLDDIEISAKSFQTAYLDFWISVLRSILPKRALTYQCSLAIMNTCIVILVVTSKFLSQDLVEELSYLISDTIGDTEQRKLDKLFKSCDPIMLIELSKVLTEKTDLLSTYDLSTKKLFVTYFNRYLRACLMRVDKLGAEKFEKYIEFVCNKELDKDTSLVLQYICVKELSSCLKSFKNKTSGKIIETYLDCMRICAKKLHKSMKRNVKGSISDEDEAGVVTNANDYLKQSLSIDCTVCIIGTSIERQDQETLDLYGDTVLKLYDLAVTRIENLVDITRSGTKSSKSPESIDSSLNELLSLYLDHKDVINAYLNYDFVDKVINLLIPGEPDITMNGDSNNQIKSDKKIVYEEIKTKLGELDEKAKKFSNSYQSIINSQYNHVVKQSLTSTSDIKKEKSCCHGYFSQMRTLGRIARQIFKSCDPKTYNNVLSKTVQLMERCDPLDHPKFLYVARLFESLVPRHSSSPKDQSISSKFRSMLPSVSCCLIRVTKCVELGPSVHAFTSAGSHKSNKAVQCCTYSVCIRIYTQIFLKYNAKFTNQFITDAMQLCISSNPLQYAKYSTRLSRFFIQLASSIAGLLKSICIGRKEEDVLRSSMPIFLSVFGLLIRCLILASDRLKIERIQENGHATNGGDVIMEDSVYEGSTNKLYEEQLEMLALDVGKTLNNLSLLRVKLVDYAPHLISTYVKDIQRASCPDFVRIHLNEGIFRIFNLVDAHQKERQEDVIESGIQRKTVAGRASGSLFEMIHARLDQASREIFKDMHDNYSRFHRYVGKC